MDRAALQDIFAYTDWVWDQIRRAAPRDDLLAARAPGSGWPDLRNCLAHVILAYDRWVPAIVDLETRPLPEIASDDFLSWTQFEAHRVRTRRALEAAIHRWGEAELQRVHEVNVDGAPVRYSRAELILHLLLHERGHHGDVTTLFWQLGIEAETAFEYRFYLRRE